MVRKLIGFSLLLGIILIISYFAHISLLDYLEISQNKLLLVHAYITNFLLVIISYIFILAFFKKQNFSLGYIFMAGFLLKMAVFALFFKPGYDLSGKIETVEFFAFFTPYSICLFTETVSLVRILNRA